jgi:predicted house-cleaning noncanonical NTP pyrophosphatase (MazG superfamily)
MASSAQPRDTAPQEAPPDARALNILVRDRVPEWLESKGNIAVWTILDDAQFDKALRDSMNRFCQRFTRTADLESLCDLMDAIDAWLELKGVSAEALTRARQERRKRCGGFDRRLFLKALAPGDRAEEFCRGRTC